LFTELARYEFIANVSDFVGADFRGKWIIAADELTELSENERAIVKSVGLSLGTSDIQGQLSMLDVNVQLLDKHCEQAGEQYIKKGKLYRSVGVLTGVLLAILLI
jgi:stage III sporulation protein AB